jgi:starch phosphorylase
MKESIRTLAPVFNTRRMVSEYVEQLYLPAMQRLGSPEKEK